MRLKLYQPAAKAHTEIAAAVGWNASSELYSCSDDHTVCKWNSRGDLEGKVGAALAGLGAQPRGARRCRRAPRPEPASPTGVAQGQPKSTPVPHGVQVCVLDGAFFTDLQWAPGGGAKKQQGGGGADLFALACTDGAPGRRSVCRYGCRSEANRGRFAARCGSMLLRARWLQRPRPRRRHAA
jgi:hypothetical protein